MQQRRMPVGVPNPLLVSADFSIPGHPYQSHYVAPNVSAGAAASMLGGVASTALPNGFGY